MKATCLLAFAPLVLALLAGTSACGQIIGPDPAAYSVPVAGTGDEAAGSDSEAEENSVDSGLDRTGGCRSGCGCEDIGDRRSSGDPWVLFPDTAWRPRVGGWIEAGYTSKSDERFTPVPGKVNVYQAYLFVQKEADGESGLDWGYRADFLYGVNGDEDQAFGSNPGTWDFKNGFDHGVYAWALPQAYGELALGDWSLMLGHFYTLVGYEDDKAPDNFFFSQTVTSYHSEPSTHTGVMARYAASDVLTLFGGWTLGWDTGFDAYQDGSNFQGGLDYWITDQIELYFIFLCGDFGWRGHGYAQGLVLDVDLTERLNYVLQTDFLCTDTDTENDDLGIIQYLLYEFNDCWRAGGRVEWWRRDGASLWEFTAGVNWSPHPNFTLRPEIRYNTGDALEYFDAPDKTWIFSVDAVLTF